MTKNEKFDATFNYLCDMEFSTEQAMQLRDFFHKNRQVTAYEAAIHYLILTQRKEN